MGWKRFRERFGISHYVHVAKGQVCIGSPYISEIVTVDPATGRMKAVESHPDFVERKYPALAAASPEEVIAVIAEEDEFSTSIKVFTFEDGEILEKYCEEVGWPNVTHDGVLMYENTFSTERAEVLEWAKNTTRAWIETSGERLAGLEKELAEWRGRLAEYEARLKRLEQDGAPEPAGQPPRGRAFF